MEDTYEIRWFLELPLRAFRDWGGPREQRTDWYAPLTIGSSSVKLREPNIEAKFFLGTSRSHIGSTEIQVERWTKISQPVPADDCEHSQSPIFATLAKEPPSIRPHLRERPK